MKRDLEEARGWTRAALIAATFAFASMPLLLHAQAYPDRPIQLVVPFPPGGGADLTGRMVADYLTRKLGQSVVIINRGGGASTIGVNFVAKAKPDGYTLLWTPSDGMSFQPAVRSSIPYRIPDDFAWVASPVSYTLALAVSSKQPYKTLQELIEFARKNPGKVTFSSSGNGSTTHIPVELIANAAGVKFTHVPYQGAGPAVTGAVSGVVDMTMGALSTIKPMNDGGQLRAIATTGTTRSAVLPDVPTLKEAGLDIDVTLVYGVLAPAGTPEPILQTLRSALAAMLKDPDVVAKIDKAGLRATLLSGDAFRTFMVKDLEKWRAVAKAANVTADE